MKYLGLLRGVNVGGNNIIKMAELKAAFENYGFANVFTYINSGNIIFENDESDVLYLGRECQSIIKESFGLDIAVAVLKQSDLYEAVNNAPAWWNEDIDARHNAIVVIPPMTVQELLEKVGTTNPEYERVSSYGSVIFWSAPKKTISRSQWHKAIRTPAYRCTTIRNANTTIKLTTL